MKIITSVKLDKDVKEKAGKLASELGLNLSLVVNASLKRFVTERRAIFSLTPEFNVKTEKKFQKIKADINNGKNLIGPFHTLSDLKRSLMD